APGAQVRRPRMKRPSKTALPRSPEKTKLAMSILANQQGAGQNQLSQVLLDPTKPVEVRAKVLLDVLNSNLEDPFVQQGVLADLLRQVPHRDPDSEALRLMEQYEQALSELQNGPVRPATFLAPAAEALPGPLP